MAGLFDRLQSELGDRQERPGLDPAGLLALPSGQRRAANILMRQGEMSLARIARTLELTPDETQSLLDELVEQGYVRRFQRKGEPRYRVILARKRGRHLPVNIWDALESKVESEE